MTAPSTPQSALYRTIHGQPDVARDVLANQSDAAEAAARVLGGARRIFLAGTGTSSHAAIVGEHLFRLAGADAYSTTHFDFVTYPRPLSAADALIAISHRGSKRYGTQAIERALAAGGPVIGVTGKESPMHGPAIILRTAPQEVSATHTASYTGNLIALAMLARDLGDQLGSQVDALSGTLDRMPDLLDGMLGAEQAVRPVAEALAARGRLILAGAGPNAATAREGALKVKESSYLVAEGFELETALHGGLQAVQAGDIAVVIAAHGPALARTCDAARALGLIGARLLLVADERAVPDLRAATQEAVTVDLITFPPVPEPLSPLLAVVPLQLLAAFTADLRGTNADSFRADDPVYKRANESYGL
jgi:glucosamine--fructose-6-phosphate aminotransferase (isomerizing)